MKTLFTHFWKVANTPPAYLIVLFAWLLMPFNSYADVTAEWGEWGSPQTYFPSGSSTINGITLSEELAFCPHSGYYYGPNGPRQSECFVYSGEYAYITITSGMITKISASVYNNPLVVEFCSSESFNDANILSTINLAAAGTSSEAILSEGVAPYGAKSARLSSNSESVLIRLVVTASAGCASPETATFAKGDATSGSVDAIEACEGSSFTMPNQGSMFKPGYLFTGWKLNNAGDLITAGTSYTMPAGGASFTAQWEEDNTTLRIPTTSILNSTNRTGGSSETIDFYDETCVYLYNTHYVEWDAYITPGSYQISMKYGAYQWGIRGTFSIIDPLGIESPRVFYTQIDESNNASPIYRNPSVTYDLSGLSVGKIYRIKVEHDWGGSNLSIAHIEFTPLGGNRDITFAKGDASVTGTLPSNTSCAADGTYELPGKGDLAWSGHTFAGWSDGSNTYAPGASYTMPNHDVTFTAQWTPMTVPAVTNLSTSAENEVVTLTYSIPGICDLSNYSVPSAQNTTEGGKTYSRSYDQEYDVVNCTGYCPQYGQYGVAFAVPNVENLEWISYDCKAIQSMASNVNIWAGVYAPSTGKMYWQFADPNNNRPTTESWKEVGPEYPAQPYWGPAYDGAPISNPITYAVSEIAIFANAGEGGAENQKFSVRNVRYHVANQEDIHHVVIMRKAGQDQASTGLDDGTLLEPGTRSRFVDSQDKAGGWYTYTVFAVHADGTLSAAVSTNVQIVEKEQHTVTYALGGGTGTLPTEPSHVEGASFTVANGDGLSYAGHTFAGWNDGTSDYAPGASYTMPDADVTLTAQWTPFVVPAVTDLSIDGENKTVNLSWNIPGFINLNTANTTNVNSATYGTTFCAVSNWEMNGDELDVIYSCDEWAMCGIAFPISVDDLESISFDCRDDNSFVQGGLYPFALADHAYYGSGITFPHTLAHHSSVFDKYWYNNSLGGVTTIDNVTEVAIVSNPPQTVEGGHFYISNLRYHCTGQIDIDHIVLVRKDGEAPSTPEDGSVLHSGAKFTFTDDDDAKEAGHTYYYTVFSVHADGSYSAPAAVSYTVPMPPALTTYTRENLHVGDFGTICLPYAIEAANREGVELFEIDSWAENGMSMTMTQLNADETMAAGRPYIFQATSTTATFRYYEIGEPAEAGSYNGLIGSYVQVRITENDDNYIIYNNKLYLVNSGNVWCGEHRAYIHKGATTPSSAPRRRVTMGLYGTQTATGIDNLQGNDVQPTKLIENGVLYILRDGIRYNVMGTKIQ